MLNTITHEIDLNMSQPNNFQYVHVMQNDYDAEYIKCTLYDGNNPYIVSCPKDSITVKCQLPNGREVESGIESTDKNIIIFKVSEKMTQVKGNVLAALSLFDTNGRKSPFPFVIKVIEAPEGVTDDDIMYGKLAEYYANLARSYAVGTDNEVRDGDATDNSKYYCEKSAKYAREAAGTASNVKSSELTAAKYASNADKSANQAAESAKQAGKSANNAADSERKSGQNKTDSKNYADLSKSYAVGTDNEIRNGDATDNSRYYYSLVKNAIDSGQLAEFEYFETYADFEKALQNNEIREDMLAVIKENIYNPSGTCGNGGQIDSALSDKSENAVQNKAITSAINSLETKINSLIKELGNIKTNIVLGDWEFTTNGDIPHEQNSLLGHSRDNFIFTDENLHIGTNNEGRLYITGSRNVGITSKEIHINGNGNESNIYIGNSDTGSGNVYLTGNVYVNGRLLT